MSRSKSQQVHLQSASGPIQIRLLDGDFDIVASGVGELKRNVEPGIYMVEMSSGIKRQEHMITVEPGQPYEDLQLVLPVQSAAPLTGLIDSEDPQSVALARLSFEPLAHHGHGARLVLFFRNPPNHKSDPIDLSRIGLRGEQLEPIGDLSKDAVSEGQAGWAGYSADLDPGGYTLHWRDKRHSRWAPVQGAGRSVDQSLWLEEGWTTAVFLATNPRHGGVPRMTGMTVHMRRIGDFFDPHPDETASRINLAQELALSGLRSGDSIVPRDLLDLLLGWKFSNPMLGIIGAHALVQCHDPKWSIFDEVVRNLRKLVPNHPDALALRLIGKLRRGIEAKTRAECVCWPPMLYDGYRGLIDRDWEEAGLIARDTMADLASARLLPQGPWTAWSSVDEELPDHLQAMPQVPEDARTLRAQASTLLEELQNRPRRSDVVTGQPEPETAPFATIGIADLALEQVRSFLVEFEGRESGRRPDFAQLERLRLPVSSVERALEEIAGRERGRRTEFAQLERLRLPMPSVGRALEEIDDLEESEEE